MDTNAHNNCNDAGNRTGGLDLRWITHYTNQLFLRMCTIQYRYHGDNSTDTMVTEFLELTSISDSDFVTVVQLAFCGDCFKSVAPLG